MTVMQASVIAITFIAITNIIAITFYRHFFVVSRSFILAL